MAESSPPPPKERPRVRLVQHDIRMTRCSKANGETRVIAEVMCEGYEDVSSCLRCERFVRIEPHEAGFVLLCTAPNESTHERTLPDEEEP